MMSLSDDKQADIIDAFNTTSRCLGDILNINNVYFDNMVSQIYPSESQHLTDASKFCLNFTDERQLMWRIPKERFDELNVAEHGR